ncbi:hypothetical protein J7I93_21625 [Bacillus sp. ISL-47]|uniref:hypothetical protein n=1 Tax=Bacillus sp. ISL-47 TaxID=2819130 RepID=UPI001BEAD9A8|nr:hypothetical protein [Bacillus sp. ISL-47]MBT2690744.1 hypothetical protein [Bacillus sp. ISL-47]MBT2709688.1 hypothetical protein [Pseudomonas sp. ISL-84]
MLALLLSLNLSTAASAKDSKKNDLECIRKQEFRTKEFNEQVTSDVFASFGHKYDEIIDQSMYINMIDLMKYSVLTAGEDAHLESLKKQMRGASNGEKRLYFFHGNPDEAYIFYKDLKNGNNMVHLKKEPAGWEVEEKVVKKGKRIPFKREKCEDDYFMKRMFNNLYQK